MNLIEGQIFIDVWNMRAIVSRWSKTGETTWTKERSLNWQALEEMATTEVSRLGSGVNISGIYPCPETLAQLALWRDDVLNIVVTAGEAQRQYGLSATTVRNALKRGQVRGRKSGGTWLLLRDEAEREWGNRG